MPAFFFATPSDIGPVLKRLDAKAPLKYIETGKRNGPNRPIYLTSSDIPNLGLASHESGSASTTYMISPRGLKNRMYVFRTPSGERRWLLSNRDNRDAVLLTTGGLWKTGTLLPGTMNSMFDTPITRQTIGWFLRALQDENFRRIDIRWLGREAVDMLRSGRRLTTTAEQSPAAFDLHLPEDFD